MHGIHENIQASQSLAFNFIKVVMIKNVDWGLTFYRPFYSIIEKIETNNIVFCFTLFANAYESLYHGIIQCQTVCRYENCAVGSRCADQFLNIHDIYLVRSASLIEVNVNFQV